MHCSCTSANHRKVKTEMHYYLTKSVSLFNCDSPTFYFETPPLSKRSRNICIQWQNDSRMFLPLCQFTLWTFCPLDDSPPRHCTASTFCLGDSPPGQFAPTRWTIRPYDTKCKKIKRTSLFITSLERLRLEAGVSIPRTHYALMHPQCRIPSNVEPITYQT